MAKMTPREIVDKQKRNTKNGVEQLKLGVDRVTEAPGKKAAAKKDKFKNRLMAAIDDGTWERNVSAVPLQDWQTSMKTKGAPRIGAGIDAADAKLMQFHTDLQAYQEPLQRQLDSMPDSTLEDAIARNRFWIENMAKFRKKPIR